MYVIIYFPSVYICTCMKKTVNKISIHIYFVPDTTWILWLISVACDKYINSFIKKKRIQISTNPLHNNMYQSTWADLHKPFDLFGVSDKPQ